MEDLFGSPSSSLPASSDITVDRDIRIASAVSQSRGPGEGGQMAAASILTRMSPSPPQLCDTEQACFFLTGCFRCWIKQPRVSARTTARCIAETVYQCHCVLRALNTATVFCASLFFLPPSLPLSLFLSGRVFCWCSCLSLMPAKKSGRG